MSVPFVRGQVPVGVRHRLDHYLENMGVTALRQIVQHYQGKPDRKLDKDACLQEIRWVFNDPEALRRVVSAQEDYQRFALFQVRQAGGSMPAAQLTAAIWASGYDHPRGSAREAASTAVLQALMNRGLVLVADPTGYGFGYGYDTGLVGRLGAAATFADERLLEQVAPIAPHPLAIATVRPPERSHSRRPAEVALSLGRLAEGIGSTGLPLTQSGRPKKPALNRVAKILGKTLSHTEPPALPLDDAPGFLSGLLLGAEILKVDRVDQEAVLTEASWERLREPFDRQSSWWVRGYQSLLGWAEYLPERYFYYEDLYTPGKLNALRAALLTALAALPDPEGWYRFADFAASMWEALAGRFSLRGLPVRYMYGRTPSEQEKLDQRHQAEVDANWNSSEQPWLEHAVRGALYQLGLVELGLGDAEPPGLLFRLSQAGVDAIWRPYRQEETAPSGRGSSAAPEPAQCWVVQANMDVIVFLDRVSADRLAFIGRVADHRSAQNYTAEYQLTRGSIYRALESGLDAAGILEGLNAASEQPLPEVVRRTVQDWAARRERIRIYQDARVLEFPDGGARQELVTRLELRGAPIGERLFRLAPGSVPTALYAELGHHIDYTLPPERSLTVGEDGTVRARTAPDLVMRELLSHWAEELPDGEGWRLTAESVRRAVGTGMPVMQLDAALAERTRDGAFAPLLRVALRAWAAGGSRSGASVSVETVLHLDDPELIRAVEASTLLRPYFARQLGPGAYIVTAGAAEELKALLATFGLDAGAAMPVPARRGRRAAK